MEILTLGTVAINRQLTEVHADGAQIIACRVTPFPTLGIHPAVWEDWRWSRGITILMKRNAEEFAIKGLSDPGADIDYLELNGWEDCGSAVFDDALLLAMWRLTCEICGSRRYRLPPVGACEHHFSLTVAEGAIALVLELPDNRESSVDKYLEWYLGRLNRHIERINPRSRGG